MSGPPRRLSREAPPRASSRSSHSVPGAVEEGLELAGWILIATAVTAVLLVQARSTISPA